MWAKNWLKPEPGFVWAQEEDIKVAVLGCLKNSGMETMGDTVNWNLTSEVESKTLFNTATFREI